MTRRHAPRPMLGFTLIELVVAMAIAAMLAALAIPTYLSYVREARRTDAKSALLNLASLEERYFSTQNRYSTAATDLGYPAWPATVGSSYYTVAQPVITGATTTAPATYILTANVVTTTDQVNDAQCQSFQVTSAGVQSAAPDTPGTCWR